MGITRAMRIWVSFCVCPPAFAQYHWSVTNTDAGTAPSLNATEDVLMTGIPWDSDGVDPCPPIGVDDVRCEFLSAHVPAYPGHRDNGVMAAFLDGRAAQSVVFLSDTWSDSSVTSMLWWVNYDVHFAALNPADLSTLRTTMRFKDAGVTMLTLPLPGQAAANNIQYRVAPQHVWTEHPETSTQWRIELTLSRTQAGAPVAIWIDNIVVSEGSSVFFEERFPPPPCPPCDVNCDGSVNLFDIQPFVELISGGGASCSPCAGDGNADGSVNLFDIEAFVACLAG